MEKGRLVIAYSTEPVLWIENLSQSPFNVALDITLEDFDVEHITELNRLYGTPLQQAEDLTKLIDWVGGHPHLVRIAMHTLATRGCSLAELESISMRQDGPFAAHLHHYFRILLEHNNLRTTVQQILADGTCDGDIHFQRLWSSGLIRGDNPQSASMRCQLYHDYFRMRL